jgi:penicillin-binding protein 1C
MRNRIKGFLKYPAILCGLFGIVLGCFCLADKLYPLKLDRFEDLSTIIYADQQPVHVFHTSDEKWRILTKVEEVDPLYVKTLIAKEDKHFHTHPGINPFALVRAAYLWLRHGHVVSGGSTITMQTARLLEPRSRKMMSKLIECFRALQLEWHYSKNDILSMYMTLAPFGGNIEGINAASLSYFQKPPVRLHPSEVALLVALVQSPTRLHPFHYPERALKAREKLLNFMANEQLISSDAAKLYQLASLPVTKAKFPREIPHLAWRLKNQFPKKTAIHTSIDLELQKRVEFLLTSYSAYLPERSNTAILIIDHQLNKPVAYIASRDFYAVEEHGFVDYITAFRSPGSTLKPFIFGLGFDLGLLKPDTYLLDERRRFGSYYPRNFDKDIHGVVKAEEALAMSLNIPVVALLNQIGVMRFLGSIKEAGINPQLPRSFESPSLAIALGGLGMSLEQLVTLYGGLAREGKVMPISYLETQTQEDSHVIFSPQAARQVTTILATDLDGNHPISLKTGTSYGYRDAWVLGYDRHYVIGIWTGIPDGTPMNALSARNLVVPLLQKVVTVLPINTQASATITSPTLSLKKLSFSNEQQNVNKTLPTLIFPIDDTAVELEKRGNDFKAIPLTVTGGMRPYTWLIDGKPLLATWQQKQSWTPAKAGYYTIAVVDANGQVDRAHIEIK